MKEHSVVDEDSGLTLIYTFNEEFGWSFRVSGHPEGRMREAILLSRKYWPETPDELREQIVDNNMKLLEVCRSVVIDID